MKHTYLLAPIFSLALACGGESTTDLFPDAPDGGSEFGAAEQELATKFSGTYSHGVTTGVTKAKCSISWGGGSGQSCVLPGYGAVKFRLVGSDPYPNSNPQSWKYLARRALTGSGIKAMAVNHGYGWPFGTEQEVSSGYWATIQNGSCPGSVASNEIYDYSCVTWTGLTTVSESLAGTYKKCGAGCSVTMTIDVDKIEDHVLAYPVSNFSFDFHEMLEHVVTGTLAGLYGSGFHMYDIRWNNNSSYPQLWSSRYASVGNLGYMVSDWSEGEGCRLGNWSSQGPNSFEALSGSCPNTF